MYTGQQFQCDICLRQVAGQDGVRNVISIENGEGSHNFAMVCDKDAKAIIGFIEELKPVKRSE